MDKTVHTVFDLRGNLTRAPGSYQVLMRTPERGLQLVHMFEVTRGGHQSIILEPVGTPESLVELATLTKDDRFYFQEHEDEEFEVVDVDCEPSHELIMEIRSLKGGWRGRIGLSTGAVDWARGSYYNTLVLPNRRGEDRGIPPSTGPIPERRRDR